MATPLETVLTMTEEELEALNKKIKKRMIAKFAINVATGVIVHIAAKFIIGAIEQKKENAKEITE